MFFFLKSKYDGGRPETCINVRFRAWNARLCMSQVFPHHSLILKKIIKFLVCLSNYGGGRPETCINVCFGAWNAHLCMYQVVPTVFEKKTNYFTNIFIISKYNGGRPESCRNVRFRLRNARLCMSQVFPHHSLIRKPIYKLIVFLIKIRREKTWDKHKHAFQALKRTFIYVWGLSHHILIRKNKYFINCFSGQNLLDEHLRHA